ncbi:short transient receptor potential channel [Elysia marginata]|uniref:Short transient receptor potential channel n=1 Tax=Elysia marginata TaxID=1093978 RepID=A0AAV4ILJ0_9GAST|nr:short transient receptor potential channel [Elysia marginata]
MLCYISIQEPCKARFQWDQYDPEIVSDVLFAIANVISFARTTQLMPAFEVLGPLQISLGRMIGDITRFMVLFTLVLFAFMVGLHNLYWYYGAQMIKMEVNGQLVAVPAAKAFQGLQQTFSSLFWSMFGQVSISDISINHPKANGVRQCVTLDGDKSEIYCTDGHNNANSKNLSGHHSPPLYTPENPQMQNSTSLVETVGNYLFGIYHVVIIIVLINMLIAMMSHSFEDIQTDCDVEWKFARTKLWLNYMDEGSTLPVPFNMIPTPKSVVYGWQATKEAFAPNGEVTDSSRIKRQTFLKKRREKVCKNMELKPDDTSYSDIMHRLVKRYLFKLERAKDEKDIEGHGNIRSEEVEIWEPDNGPPPPIPEVPSRIPYATPPIPEEDDDKSYLRGYSKRKGCSRSHLRRHSSTNVPVATTLAIPQLDAIQRSQKLLDMRLQQLQANHKETNRLQDDVEFIRRLMAENQKALCNVVQALANIQGEIVSLVQCLKPQPKTQPQQHPPQMKASAHPLPPPPPSSTTSTGGGGGRGASGGDGGGGTGGGRGSGSSTHHQGGLLLIPNNTHSSVVTDGVQQLASAIASSSGPAGGALVGGVAHDVEAGVVLGGISAPGRRDRGGSGDKVVRKDSRRESRKRSGGEPGAIINALGITLELQFIINCVEGGGKEAKKEEERSRQKMVFKVVGRLQTPKKTIKRKQKGGGGEKKGSNSKWLILEQEKLAEGEVEEEGEEEEEEEEEEENGDKGVRSSCLTA